MSSLPISTSEHDELPPAHSLSEAVNSGNTLMGYAAMNDPNGESEIAQYAAEHPRDEQWEISLLAYQFYVERGGENGSADEDWHRAAQQVRGSRTEPNT